MREVWPMTLPLMNHSALALFAQCTRIPTSARSIGFCVIWVCISSSSSSSLGSGGSSPKWLVSISIIGIGRLRGENRNAKLISQNSPGKCLVYLGRDTRTSTQSRRLVRRKDASWSLNWPSGANLLVHKLHKYILCVPL